MKKNAIIGIGAAVLVGAGAWLLLKNKKAVSNTAVTSGNGTTVADPNSAISQLPTKVTVTGEKDPLGGIDYIYKADIIGGNKYDISWECIGGTIVKNGTTKDVTVNWPTTGRYKVVCTVKSADGASIKGEFVVTESFVLELDIDFSGLIGI